MRQYITAQHTATKIRMTRSQFTGAFLIVEGETSDLRIYRRLINSKTCQIIPAHGKKNAMQSLTTLENEQFRGVLAIVDADFWRLEGKQPLTANLFITDTHDLETMLLVSPALEKLLVEFGSPPKITKFVQKKRVDVRQILLDIGKPIGYFRWVSQRDGYDLTFNGIRYSQFINKKTLLLNVMEMIKTVKNKSKKYSLDEKQLQNLIVESTNDEHNLWDVCCGHDLVCILSIALSQVLGSSHANDVKPELLEKFLRTGYEAVYFYTTQLYQSLKNWERDNDPFQIFPSQSQPMWN